MTYSDIADAIEFKAKQAARRDSSNNRDLLSLIEMTNDSERDEDGEDDAQSQMMAY